MPSPTAPNRSPVGVVGLDGQKVVEGADGRARGHWGEGTVPSEDRDRITVLFDRAGCHTPSLEAPPARDGPLAVVRRPGEDRPAP
ncbi:hypothetical protein AB0H51_09085 [Streptomyces griseoluteus]|uniref:hypothetical protein n=1 Tax=Streptomyces griseoluteus TaxID=29306 RepID=UPI00340C7E99